MFRIYSSKLLVSVFFALVFVTAGAAAQSKPAADPDVVYNVQSSIYHRPTCSSARRCTKNCVEIKLSDAKKRGGRACQICGGPAVSQDDLRADRHGEHVVTFVNSHTAEGID